MRRRGDWAAVARLTTLVVAITSVACGRATVQPPGGIAGASGAPAAAAAPAGAVDSARRLVERMVAAERIPGLSVSVTAGSAVLWEQGFGFADVVSRTPVSADTRFRVGSLSKLITAAALMRMVEAGKLDLDVPVRRYLALGPPLDAVTLRQLAGHQAGVRHYRGAEFLTTKHYASVGAALAIFAADSLLFQPGTRYSYSSYGYNLIGAVLAAADRRSFSELVRARVLDPLSMHHTVLDDRAATIADRATGYSVTPLGTAPAPDDDLSGRWPSGGYLSTSGDLARLGQSVLAPGFLGWASLATMLTPQRLASGAETIAGIGWRAGTDSAGRRYYHHGGASNGGRGFLLVYPAERLVVALAANATTGWGEPEAVAIARIFLNDAHVASPGSR